MTQLKSSKLVLLSIEHKLSQDFASNNINNDFAAIQERKIHIVAQIQNNF